VRWGNLADDLIIVAVIPLDGHVFIVGVRQQSLPTLHPPTRRYGMAVSAGWGQVPGRRLLRLPWRGSKDQGERERWPKIGRDQGGGRTEARAPEGCSAAADMPLFSCTYPRAVCACLCVFPYRLGCT
jgi:hypothetical protein